MSPDSRFPMKLRRGLVAGALFALAVPALAAALERNDTLKRDFAFGGGVVVIDNVFGSVEVRSGAAGAVSVEIRRHAEARRGEDLELAFAEVELEVLEENGRLELAQDGPFRCDGDWRGSEGRRRSRHGCRWDPDYDVSWEWIVTVPADVDLDVSTVNGGEVRVEGVRGRVEAHNVNGRLTLAGLVGEVKAVTVNGRIHAAFAAAPAEPARFHTVNGEIELSLPAGSGAEIGFETMNGEIYTDFEAVALPQRATPKRDGRGRNSYRLDRDTVVRIGAGGPRIDCETLNGDIVVREI